MTLFPITPIERVENQLKDLTNRLEQISNDQNEIKHFLERQDPPSSEGQSAVDARPPVRSIEKPEPHVINGRKVYKIFDSDIAAVVNRNGDLDADRVKRVMKTMRRYRQRAVSSLVGRLSESPQTARFNNAHWNDITWSLREPEILSFEQIVHDSLSVALNECVANWAADHLLEMTWDNKANYRINGKPKRARRSLAQAHPSSSTEGQAGSRAQPQPALSAQGYPSSSTQDQACLPTQGQPVSSAEDPADDGSDNSVELTNQRKRKYKSNNRGAQKQMPKVRSLYTAENPRRSGRSTSS